MRKGEARSFVEAETKGMGLGALLEYGFNETTHERPIRVRIARRGDNDAEEREKNVRTDCRQQDGPKSEGSLAASAGNWPFGASAENWRARLGVCRALVLPGRILMRTPIVGRDFRPNFRTTPLADFGWTAQLPRLPGVVVRRHSRKMCSSARCSRHHGQSGGWRGQYRARPRRSLRSSPCRRSRVAAPAVARPLRSRRRSAPTRRPRATASATPRM